jgi:transposase InsO family protein
MKDQKKSYEVKMMCRALNVSRGGYYAWLRRPVSGVERRRAELIERIRVAHEQSRGIYGSPRIHAELLDQEVEVCVNTVAKLMKEAGIRSKIKRRFVVRTTDSNHDQPVMKNVLDRQFDAEDLNRKWCCDITYIPTGQGYLYLAVVMDLCSRRIVGWSMADHLRTELCMNALHMAIESRRPDAGLLHHSDRGVQYASEDYMNLLKSLDIDASMSRTGNCYDNAVMESFFNTLKTELVYHENYASPEQARQSIFEYIEVFYNRQRRHSAIGYKSPETFEASLN